MIFSYEKSAAEKQTPLFFAEEKRVFFALGGAAPEARADSKEAFETVASKQEINDQFKQAGLDTPRKQELGLKVMGALSWHESGDQYEIRGVTMDKGKYKGEKAIGRYQIMPGNWNNWSKEVFGKVVEATPKNQDLVAARKIGEYVQFGLDKGKGNTNDAIRLAAVKWYGNMGAKNGLNSVTDISTSPVRIKHSNGKITEHPSPEEFSKIILVLATEKPGTPGFITARTKFRYIDWAETPSSPMIKWDPIEQIMIRVPDALRQAKKEIIHKAHIEGMHSNEAKTLNKIFDYIESIHIPLSGEINSNTVTVLKTLGGLQKEHSNLFGEIVLAVPATKRIDGRIMDQEYRDIFNGIPTGLQKETQALFADVANTTERDQAFRAKNLTELNDMLGSNLVSLSDSKKDLIRDIYKKSTDGTILTPNPLIDIATKQVSKAQKKAGTSLKLRVTTSTPLSEKGNSIQGAYMELFQGIDTQSIYEADEDRETSITALATILENFKTKHGNIIKFSEAGKIISPDLAAFSGKTQGLAFDQVKIQALLDQIKLNPDEMQNRFPDNFEKTYVEQTLEQKEAFKNPDNFTEIAIMVANEGRTFKNRDEFVTWIKEKWNLTTIDGTKLIVDGRLTENGNELLSKYELFKKAEKEVEALIAQGNTKELIERIRKLAAHAATPEEHHVINGMISALQLQETTKARITALQAEKAASQSTLDALKDEIGTSLVQDIKMAEMQIISARISRQRTGLGAFTGIWEEWSGDRNLSEARNVQEANMKAIQVLQDYAVYLVEKQQRKILTIQKLRTQLALISYYQTEIDKPSTQPEEKAKYENLQAQAENARDNYAQILDLQGNTISPETLAAKQESLWNEDLAANANTNEFIEKLYGEYDQNFLVEALSAESATVRPLKQGHFSAIITSAVATARVEASLQLAECSLSQMGDIVPSNEALGGMLLKLERDTLGLGNVQNVDLKTMKRMEQMNERKNARDVLEAITKDNASDAEIDAALGITISMAEKLHIESTPNLEEAANNYKEALRGNGMFSDKMSGGFKLLLAAALLGAVFKYPDKAVMGILGAGAATFAMGASDPFDAISKIMDKGGDAGKDVLANMGIGKRAEWVDEEKKYGIEITDKDALAYDLMGNLSIQHIFDLVDNKRGTIDQLGKGSEPVCNNPGLLNLAMRKERLTTSFGLTEKDMEKALAKILQMRALAGGENRTASKDVYDGYLALQDDLQGGTNKEGKRKKIFETTSFKDWTFQTLEVHDGAKKEAHWLQAMGIGADQLSQITSWFGEVTDSTKETLRQGWGGMKETAFDALSIPDPNNPTQRVWFIKTKEGSTGNFFLDSLGNLYKAGENFTQTETWEALGHVGFALDDALDYLGVSSQDVWMPKNNFNFPPNREGVEQEKLFKEQILEADKTLKPLVKALGFAEENFPGYFWFIPGDSIAKTPIDALTTGEAGEFQENRAFGLLFAARMGIMQELYWDIKSGNNNFDEIQKAYKAKTMDIIAEIVDGDSPADIEIDGDNVSIKEWLDTYQKAKDPEEKYKLILAFEDSLLHSSILFDFNNIDVDQNKTVLLNLRELGTISSQSDSKWYDWIWGIERGIQEEVHDFYGQLEKAYANDPDNLPPPLKGTEPNIYNFTVDPFGQNESVGGGELFGQAMFLYKEFLTTALDPTTGEKYDEDGFKRYKEYIEKTISKNFHEASPFSRLTIKNTRRELDYYKVFITKENNVKQKETSENNEVTRTQTREKELSSEEKYTRLCEFLSSPASPSNVFPKEKIEKFAKELSKLPRIGHLTPSLQRHTDILAPTEISYDEFSSFDENRTEDEKQDLYIQTVLDELKKNVYETEFGKLYDELSSSLGISIPAKSFLKLTEQQKKNFVEYVPTLISEGKKDQNFKETLQKFAKSPVDFARLFTTNEPTAVDLVKKEIL